MIDSRRGEVRVRASTLNGCLAATDLPLAAHPLALPFGRRPADTTSGHWRRRERCSLVVPLLERLNRGDEQ